MYVNGLEYKFTKFFLTSRDSRNLLPYIRWTKDTDDQIEKLVAESRDRKAVILSCDTQQLRTIDPLPDIVPLIYFDTEPLPAFEPLGKREKTEEDFKLLPKFLSQ